jgi:hypothetical protein
MAPIMAEISNVMANRVGRGLRDLSSPERLNPPAARERHSATP